MIWNSCLKRGVMSWTLFYFLYFLFFCFSIFFIFFSFLFFTVYYPFSLSFLTLILFSSIIHTPHFLFPHSYCFTLLCHRFYCYPCITRSLLIDRCALPVPCDSHVSHGLAHSRTWVISEAMPSSSISRVETCTISLVSTWSIHLTIRQKLYYYPFAS